MIPSTLRTSKIIIALTRNNRYTNFNSRKFQKRLSLRTGSPNSKYVLYATACVYRELYGKITDRKKKCVNNYLI